MNPERAYIQQYREHLLAAGFPPPLPKNPNRNHRGYGPKKIHPNPPKVSKFNRAEVIAWDGESTTENGEHRYVLLANSNGEHIINLDGLSTEECLTFLCDAGKRKPHAIHVAFGASYDVNMMLGDMDRETIDAIWHGQGIRWRDFRIEYTPRKEFNVWQYHNPMQWNVKGKRISPIWKAHVTLWDCFGFTQASFVTAMKMWLPNEDTEFVASMKLQRGQFDAAQLEEIVRYNHQECVLLKTIHEKCLAAHKEAGIVISRHDGAGATAAALLKKHKVRGYMQQEPEAVYTAARYAYAGGRIEAIKIGNAERKTIRKWDINSAYPSVMPTLPCLNHGTWEYVQGESILNFPFAVAHVRWTAEPSAFYPFFYRNGVGSITFPQDGEGWYWTPEILAAQENPDVTVEVLEGWGLQRNCQCQPFAWVPEVYEHRLKFKAEGNHAQYAIKLGMNALYGKLAQQAGWLRSKKLPAYHQLSWAGYITSMTRAKMYAVTWQQAKHVIAFATDGIFTTCDLDVPISNKLGEWSLETYDGMTIAQAGVYWLKEKDGEWSEKYRGFDKGSISREGVVSAWRERAGYTASLTRFVTAGSALVGDNAWEQWRTWQTRPRVLDITPTGKRYAAHREYDYSTGLRPTFPVPNLTPEQCSELYSIEWLNGNMRELIDGVDIRIIEDEWEDTWV